MLILKWSLLLLGVVAIIAVVLLAGLIFVDYHVGRIDKK
jgi:hypothetical protein